jgi:hypothetical protein
VTSRAAVVVLLLVLLGLVAYAVFVEGAGGERIPAKRTVAYGVIRFNGVGPERWAQRWRQEHRRVLELKRELRAQRRLVLARPHVVEAINLSCVAYGFCSTLWRKARCETGGTFSATAANPSGASGLFQFLPSTWRSTPYGVFSVWSPYANALAAGWMHLNGRGGEWSCQ